MNYELAKQLKDAGFMPERQAINIFIHDSGENEELLFPTLSELIEACIITRPTFTLSTTFGPYGWGDCKWESVSLGIDTQEGHTPEEAVAKLWLELNKK